MTDTKPVADRALEQMCRAHHQVRTEQGFTTAPWEKLEERNRQQYRDAMQAALSTQGQPVAKSFAQMSDVERVEYGLRVLASQQPVAATGEDKISCSYPGCDASEYCEAANHGEPNECGRGLPTARQLLDWQDQFLATKGREPSVRDMNEARSSILNRKPVAATGDDERPGMVAAARWIAKRRDDYLRDNCASSFGAWDLKDAQAEYVGELSEIEEHLLLMAGATCRDKTQYVGSTGMCLLCGADQGVSCRAAQRTAQAERSDDVG